MSLKIVYAGTPEFAAESLKSIVTAGFQVPLVLTQPDRPAGRGMKLRPSAVKTVALDHNIPVQQPTSLRLDGGYADEAQVVKEMLKSIQPDVIVVAAYGLILPQWVLDLPRYGCLNIHASLLPRWRGAAPIHRAIEAGDKQTGIGIMQMDAGLDTGAILLESTVQIANTDTTATLHDKLTTIGATLILEVLEKLPRNELTRRVQNVADATYAHKIEKAESQVRWNDSAIEIERRIRAFDPFPGVVTQYGEITLKLWKSELLNPVQELKTELGVGVVIAVDAQGIVVNTGAGQLRVTELQRPGGRRQPAHEFLQSISLKIGDQLS